MQSNGARIAVAVLSVAAIVVLFVVLSGGDDESTTTSTEVAQTTTTETNGGDQPTEPEPPQKPEEPELPLVEIVGGEPQNAPVEIEAVKGENVEFEVESDTDQELHIHGYDIYEDVVAGKPSEVSFPAEIDGVFEVELHSTGALAAEITVTP